MANFLIDENITEQERYEYAIKYMADLYDDFHCCLACVKDYDGYSDGYTVEYSKEISACDNCFTKQVYDYLMKFSPSERTKL